MDPASTIWAFRSPACLEKTICRLWKRATLLRWATLITAQPPMRSKIAV